MSFLLSSFALSLSLSPQICREIRGLGCVIHALVHAGFTQPSPHIFLYSGERERWAWRSFGFGMRLRHRESECGGGREGDYSQTFTLWPKDSSLLYFRLSNSQRNLMAAAAAAAKETKIWKKGRVWLWQSRMKANWEGRGIALIRRVAAEGKEGGLFCVVVTLAELIHIPAEVEYAMSRPFKYRGGSAYLCSSAAAASLPPQAGSRFVCTAAGLEWPPASLSAKQGNITNLN